MWHIWYMYKWTSLIKESPFEWFTIDLFIHIETYKVVLLTNYRTWTRLCNTRSIDIDPRSLVKWKWEWDIRNSRDSSVGRAEDWKSSCHQFKSGSWHMINLYESLLYQFIDMNTYSLSIFQIWESQWIPNFIFYCIFFYSIHNKNTNHKTNETSITLFNLE